MLSIGVTQDRVATPSMCTVQAPHSAAPQPNLVPVMPSTSRRTQSNGVSPSTSALCAVPLTLMLKAMLGSPFDLLDVRARGPRPCSIKLRPLKLFSSEPTDMMSKSVLDVPRTMEAARHQRLDPGLRGGPSKRGDEGVPLRCYLSIRRQACRVNQALGVCDGLLVERGNPHRQSIDEALEFGVGKGAVDVSVALGEVAADIIGAEQDFQRPTAANEARQSRHRPAARHQAGADFPLRQDSSFAARKAHVACQRELAADARRPPADR